MEPEPPQPPKLPQIPPKLPEAGAPPPLPPEPPALPQTPSKPPQTIQERFPGMQPVTTAPTLFRINGCGISVYGKRDFDPDTRTYVKTHCFCIVFIPLLALGAYRVADANNGWYFIGKERLSKFAKGWNWVMLACFLSLIGAGVIDSYTSSPEYVAKQELKQAQGDLQAGRFLKAAGTFKKLANGPLVVRQEAKLGLQTSLEGALKSESPDVVAAGIRALANAGDNLNKPAPLIPDSFKRGLTLVDKFGAKDPEIALKILAEVIGLDPTNPSIESLKLDWLKRTVNAHPENIDRLVELALVYEGRQQLDESHALLMTQRQKLGSTEGARILGRHLMQKGDYAESYSLLYPYVQNRLEKLHGIERDYTNSIAEVNRRALKDLREGHGGESFYQAYDKASKMEKETMVESYLEKQLQRDANYQRAIAELKGANQIVGVALDLGIVQLNRAQDLRDAAARKTELEAAEKTFLAIRGFAGDSDEYRLFLGQVYYWLGKSVEGKDLFDKLLASHARAPSILLALSKTFRDVGERSHARELAEEAYRDAKDLKVKYAAASLRAHLQKDIDDQITWFKNCDPEQPSTQIGLNNALGEKAVFEGNRKQAAEYLRKTIASYSGMQKSATTLNNAGLACLSLYEVTGDSKDHDRGLQMLEEAVTLDPGSSLLLINFTHHLISRAVMDTVQDSLRLNQLGEVGVSVLAYLYSDESGQKAIFKKLRDSDRMKKALINLDKALLLAPKDLSLYEKELSLFASFRDLPELQKLQQRFRLAKIDLDLAEETKEILEAYRGTRNKEYLEKTQTSIQKLEKLLQAEEIQLHPPTRAWAQASVLALKERASTFGLQLDGKKLLAEAEAIYKAQPNAATRGELTSALYFCGSQELSLKSPEYAKLSRETQPFISSRYLVALLMEQNGPLASLIRENPMFKRALGLEKESNHLFPSFPSIERWALLRHTDADEAAFISASLKANEMARLIDQLQYDFNPASASVILDQYWTFRLLGDEKKALEVYQAAIRLGVPLPATN